MELVNCMVCGKLTIDRYGGCCHECVLERERLMSQIKDYLHLNNGAGINEIIDSTGIPLRTVIDLLHEGRLSADRSVKPQLINNN
ncbi:MAG: hypothetical protein ACYC21_10900 [Eubacteriales bacterium]|nr:hypothetical protein [Bacillota bacterium]